jgi:hypothetical protein
MRVVDLSRSRGFAARLTHGRELAGEERVVGVLAGLLDDAYLLVRHYRLPDDPYDLDMILIGPAGLWQFEILHFTGLVKTDAGWMYWDYKQQGLQPIPYELISRTRDKVVRLTQYLAERGLPGLEISQVLILSTPNAPHDFSLPGLDVAFVDEVEELIKTAQSLFRPSNPLPVDRLARVLTGGKGDTAPAPDEAEAESAGPPPAPQPLMWGMTRMQVIILAVLAAGVVCILVAFIAIIVYYNFNS